MASFHDFTMKTLTGEEKKLADYNGKAVLVVNVASACGKTPQYAGLQKLHEKYGEKGLAVVGFPANEFGAQEPGSDSEIGEFCETKYGVKFDMFSKIVVKGEGIHPLYQWLTEESGHDGEIPWNFAKFLIGKDGQVVTRWGHRVEPESDEVVKAIEAAL